MFKTPILFLIFKRDDVTQKVFDKIKQIKPSKLFVAADGPKDSNEKTLCDKTRNIINQVDWDCEVHKLYRDNNLGLKKAVTTAIDWFFDNVEHGIILEDDCLPSDSFFEFCEENLNYHKNNNQIMHIAGINIQNNNVRGDESYYFSKIMHCWGWATWKRAWAKNDSDLSMLNKYIESDGFLNAFNNEDINNFFINNLKKVKDNIIQSWALIWSYSILKENGLCINPNINMVSNIGFGDNCTNTANNEKNLANMQTYNLATIKHPSKINSCIEADLYEFKKYYL